MHRVIYLPVQSACGDWFFEGIVQRQQNGAWVDVSTPSVY